jgi:hypothetical protein
LTEHNTSEGVRDEINQKAGQTSVSSPPVPWEDTIAHLRRPSTRSFHQLAATLVRANQAAEAGDDELHVVLLCIVGVLKFLDADVVIRGAGIARPLGSLAAALHDLDLGARPRFF